MYRSLRYSVCLDAIVFILIPTRKYHELIFLSKFGLYIVSEYMSYLSRSYQSQERRLVWYFDIIIHWSNHLRSVSSLCNRYAKTLFLHISVYVLHPRDYIIEWISLKIPKLLHWNKIYIFLVMLVITQTLASSQNNSSQWTYRNPIPPIL